MREKKLKADKREAERHKKRNSPKGGTWSQQVKKMSQDDWYLSEKTRDKNISIKVKRKK